MKYEILVEGGFTGIPRKYEGDLDLDQEGISRLLELMNASSPPSTEIRDGLTYHVTLFDNEKSIEALFDENALPKEIRALSKS